MYVCIQQNTTPRALTSHLHSNLLTSFRTTHAAYLSSSGPPLFNTVEEAQTLD